MSKKQDGEVGFFGRRAVLRERLAPTEEEKTVESALQNTDAGIMKGLAEQKLDIVKRVDTIGEQLMHEQKRLLEKELKAQKTSAKSEFSARKATLAASEKELADLRSRVESIPAELARVRAETEKATAERIEPGYRHAADLLQKEIEGERKLNQRNNKSASANDSVPGVSEIQAFG